MILKHSPEKRLWRLRYKMGLVVSIALALLAAPATAADPKLIQLFNGTNLDGWFTYTSETKFVNPGAFTVTNGTLKLSGGHGDKAYFGGIITTGKFSNFRLSLEYKWGAPTYGERVKAGRDSGILLHCVGSPEGGQWPPCIEANIMEGDSGSFWLVPNRYNGPSVDFDGKPVDLGITVEAEKLANGEWQFKPGAPKRRVTGANGSVNWGGRDLAYKDELGFRGKHDFENPFGEWTKVECVCVGDTIEVFVNGKLANRATECSLTAGQIGLQTEAADIYYRNILLIPLPPK